MRPSTAHRRLIALTKKPPYMVRGLLNIKHRRWSRQGFAEGKRASAAPDGMTMRQLRFLHRQEHHPRAWRQPSKGDDASHPCRVRWRREGLDLHRRVSGGISFLWCGG